MIGSPRGRDWGATVRLRVFCRCSLVILTVVWIVVPPATAQSGAIAFQRIDVTGLPQVEVYFTVTNADGASILGLTPNELLVDLDGTPQQMTVLRSALEGDERLAVALLFDRSGSMKAGLETARAAARDFLERLSEGDQAAIISFDDTVAVEVELTADRALLVETVEAIERGRDTALHDAILAGIASLDEATTGRKAVIVLSDGMDTRSQSTRGDVLARAQSQGVAIYTLGLPVEADQETLRELAQETGGTYLQATSSEELQRLYQLIAEQLQNQYFLSFTSTFGSDESWHRLGMTYESASGSSLVADREFLASTGPGISRGRLQGFQQDIERGGLLAAAGIGAFVGLVSGLLLLLLVKASRPQAPLAPAIGAGVLIAASALGAFLGSLALLAFSGA